MLSFFWRDKIDKIRWWWNPRQKWLKIPNYWIDKPELIQSVLEQSLIHFVYEEKGLENLAIDIADELAEVYFYVEFERCSIEAKLEKAYPTRITDDWCCNVSETKVGGINFKSYEIKPAEEIFGMSFEDAYREVHRLGRELEEKDKWAAETIFKYREYLWT